MINVANLTERYRRALAVDDAGFTIPFTRLVVVELRKAVDTRAGSWLLLLVVGTSVAALGYELAVGDHPPTFGHLIGRALFGPQLLLPVVGVLTMTSEWTQRTALATFTLVPQRGRVIAAKILAVLALSAGVVVAVAAATAVAALAGGLTTGTGGGGWAEVGHAGAAALATTLAAVVSGIAFGALLHHTAAALVLYFLAPMAWNLTAAALLPDDAARWLDVFAAFDAIGRLDLTAFGVPTLVALVVWIGLPIAVGVARSLRREIA